MGAPRAELDDVPTPRRMDNARGLGGDQGFESDGGEQIGLRNLAFDQRRADVHHRLAFVEHRAFGNREDIPGEAEIGEIIPEVRRDAAEVLESRAGTRSRPRSKLRFSRYSTARCRPAARTKSRSRGNRRMAEFESPDVVLLAGGKITRGHGQLVQIGEKTVQAISSLQAWAPDRA